MEYIFICEFVLYLLQVLLPCLLLILITGVQCPDPETELSVSSVVLSNGQNYQSVATVTCVDGYEFLPTSTAVCGQTEQWNPPISCQSKPII